MRILFEKNDKIKSFDESDDNFNKYSEEIKDYIYNYGEYYEYTKNGRKEEIERINKEIELLKSRRNSLI